MTRHHMVLWYGSHGLSARRLDFNRLPSRHGRHLTDDTTGVWKALLAPVPPAERSQRVI